MPIEIFAFIAFAVVIGLFLFYVRWIARLAGKFEEWIYVETSDAELPQKTLAYFQKIERELVPLGFKWIATCLQRPKPKLTYVRHLIHANPRVLATIDDIRYPFCQTQAFGLVSVLENGLYIESSALNMPLPQPGTDKLRFVIKPRASAKELLEIHLAAVREAEEEQDSPAIVFEPKQYREVSTYGHRLAAWDMYHKGIKHEPPTALAELAAK